MLPEQFSLRPRKGGGTPERLKTLRQLLKNSELKGIVNACDAGREGELIFRFVYDLLGCTLPVQRLWVSSLTDQAILGAWGALRPGEELDALADAARCRAESDWLVGLNATRALTCLARGAGGDQLLSVGRVQTPTLAMIVARDLAIEAFVAEDFWRVSARFSASDAEWKGRWFRPTESEPGKKTDEEGEEEAPHAERLGSAAAAESIVRAVQEQVGSLALSERKQSTERPPLLYDLTSLQRRANQRHGYTAARTLELAQALYERHKLITYPRTDARFLTSDQVSDLPRVVRGVGRVGVYSPFCEQILSGEIKPGKRVVDDAEVGDHHAIIPTGKTPESSRLELDEKRIYDLVARRFLAALSEPARFEITQIIVEIDPAHPLDPELEHPEGEALRFRARGRICTHEGWRAVDPPAKKKAVDLPLLEPGQDAQVEEARSEAGQTRPPRPHTDASLLKSMETAGRDLSEKDLMRVLRGAGLGTPATRAAILQTLIHRGYVRRQGKQMHATDRGKSLVAAVPIDELKSAQLTGEWEARLSKMAEGSEDRAAFMADIRENVARMVEQISAAEPPPPERAAQSDAPVLGACPVCADGRVIAGRGAWGCDRWREGCELRIPFQLDEEAITPAQAVALIAEGRCGALRLEAGVASRQSRSSPESSEESPD
jgi:DNA topoisomerase-3